MSQLINNLINDEYEDDDDDDNDNDDDYKPDEELSGESEKSGDDLSDTQEEEEPNNKNAKRKRSRRKKASKSIEVKSINDEHKETNNELNEEESKNKADLLWAEFCKDMPVKRPSLVSSDSHSPQSTSKSDVHESSDKINGNKKVLINKVFDFAGESVSVTEEVDVDSLEAKKLTESKKSDEPKAVPVTGVKRNVSLVGSIIEKLTKKPKMSTLQKSALDWKHFKKEEGIEEEMQQHKSSKNAYVEKQAFLQRSDLRQFEIEKEIRAKNRVKQQFSTN